MGFAISLFLTAAALSASPSTDTVDVPVLARSVEKGELLGASDFTQAPLRPSAARGAIPPSQALGQEALRRLREGSPVRATDIVAPRIIRRGQAVTITLISGPLSINAPGRALSDAAVGEPVRVINLSSNRTLDAVADASGRARMTPQ